MPALIIVTIYVLICAKTVLDKKQIEKTYVVYIFLQTRHILSNIYKKKKSTIQKQLDVLNLGLNAKGNCQVLEIMCGMLLENKAQVYFQCL